MYSIAPSPRNASLIWAGTDDGLIHLTRDSGKTWQNVTPPSLTPWSKVGIIEASHFDATIAYAAIDRHRLEDYRPHILRTRDSGKTWMDVATGIPDGAFVNVVREDKLRKGLLFAGTELGIYVSFDDADHWQPLQQNLPVTSVRDIDVHGDDLVVATHGRAFWILDNVSPLRELVTIAAKSAHLFKPQIALRVRPGSDEGTPQPPEIAKGDNPPQGAIIDYYVDGACSSLERTKQPGYLKIAPCVVIEIRDAKGEIIRSWSSDDKPPKVDPKSIDIPMYWFAPPATLSAARGHHRWIWDMHYAAPEGVSGRRRRGGNAGPWAPPGDYTVRLSYGGKAASENITLEQRLTLKPDPRIKAPQSLYDQQFATSMRAMQSAARLAPAIQQATTLQKQLADAQAKTKLRALDDFSKKLDAIAGTTFMGLGPEGSDHLTLRSVSADLSAVSAAADSADAPVTAEAQNALRNSAQQVPLLLSQWQLLITQLPSLNEQLRSAGQPQLTPLSPSPTH
ncbi:MAG: hypothetical protein NVS9B15_26460 [Acidobacteriaceae bacterium]